MSTISSTVTQVQQRQPHPPVSDRTPPLPSPQQEHLHPPDAIGLSLTFLWANARSRHAPCASGHKKASPFSPQAQHRVWRRRRVPDATPSASATPTHTHTHTHMQSHDSRKPSMAVVVVSDLSLRTAGTNTRAASFTLPSPSPPCGYPANRERCSRRGVEPETINISRRQEA